MDDDTRDLPGVIFWYSIFIILFIGASIGALVFFLAEAATQ